MRALTYKRAYPGSFYSLIPQGPSYSPAGRTPKSVLAALEAYELSTIQFDEEDEEFQPNPCNIAGFFKQQATIPVSVSTTWRSSSFIHAVFFESATTAIFRSRMNIAFLCVLHRALISTSGRRGPFSFYRLALKCMCLMTGCTSSVGLPGLY